MSKNTGVIQTGLDSSSAKLQHQLNLVPQPCVFPVHEISRVFSWLSVSVLHHVSQNVDAEEEQRRQ